MKLKFFYFLIKILSPPYLITHMCGGFFAKFQVSRMNSKKSPQHSVAESHLAIFATVWVLVLVLGLVLLMVTGLI